MASGKAFWQVILIHYERTGSMKTGFKFSFFLQLTIRKHIRISLNFPAKLLL